jgi:hypothetical protein
VSETTKVRVGVQSARELELEVEDPDAVKKTIEAAMASGDPVVWLTDTRGHQFGILVDKLVFVEVEYARGKPGVGFAAIP